jgi:hypothetical protein
MTDFLFRKVQMPATKVNELMDILAMMYPEKPPPYANKDDMFNLIDSTELGDKPWQCFTVQYTGETTDNSPSWQRAEYEVWFRNPDDILSEQLQNPTFATEMDFTSKRVYNPAGSREYKDFMSGNWAWRKSVGFIQNYII